MRIARSNALSRANIGRARPRSTALGSTQRNAVLIGGTGTGKSHIAIAIGANCVRNGARVRFFTAVDLVNQLEAEAHAGKAGKLADQLVRVDLVILDELGYLPFPVSGGEPRWSR